VISAQTPLIAHVIFRLDVGGLENGLVNLINGLPADEFRHAIICIDQSTEFADRITRNNIEIVEIRKRPGFDPAALWRLLKTIKRLDPDILHTRNLAALDALLPGMLAGVRRRIHGEHGWDVNDLGGQSRKYQWLRKLHSPLVTRYVTVSRHLKDYLVDSVGIDAGRVVSICNGVDVDRFQPISDKPQIRTALPPTFSGDTVVFGTVGRMQAVKDHLGLVEAFVQLVKNSDKGRCVRRLSTLLRGLT
jgi:sugar transferase (PEP-CTERM/EpsH1 system associated)